MGINPEIKPHKLDKKLVKWLLYPRNPIQAATDTIEVDAKNINYAQLEEDILLLNVVKNSSNVLPLLPATKPLAKGEKAYLIGCPYFQEDCKQNVYELTYKGYQRRGMWLNFDLSQELAISGFSGAPIVNGQGKVVGVLSGTLGATLVATSIEALGTISINE
jgi:S1-C subfamily serine protease